MKTLNLTRMHSVVKYTAGLLITLITFSSMSAPAPFDTGPEIDSPMPQLAVLDQFGNQQQLSNILKEKGAVIVLFRSADWCSFCKKHLLELNEQADNFIKKGYGVAGISYDAPKTLRKFSQDKKLKFSLLSDQKVKTFETLNVVNQDYKPGARHYGIPYPGVLVIDKDGKLQQKYFFEGYKTRVKFDELIKKL